MGPNGQDLLRRRQRPLRATAGNRIVCNANRRYFRQALVIAGLLTMVGLLLPGQGEIAGTAQAAPGQEEPRSAPAPGCTTYSTSIQKSPQGGYWADGFINNTQVSLHIDTGANVVAVPLTVARSAGLAVGRAGQATTASDVITAFRTDIPVLRIGNLVFRNVKAAIIPQAPNDEVLLGMSALESVSMHQEQGVMVLATEVCSQPSAAGTIAAPEQREPDVILKRPVRDCIGPNNIIDRKALECMKAK